MKWFTFAILAGVTLVFQTTLAQAMAVHSVWPDWMFVLAVHYALWGPWPDAAIAAFILGLLVDVQTAPPDPVGLYAFCYGAAACAILKVRQALFRDHPVTHVVVTLLFALAVRLVIAAYHAWRCPGELSWNELWWAALLTATYTAFCAPYLHWPLIRLGRWTGLQPVRS